ncbi:unnamed protein product, partial [Adineta ricciae]
EYQKTGTIVKRSANDSDYSDNDFTSNDEQDLLSDIDDFNQQTFKLQQQQYQQQNQSQTPTQQQQQQTSRRANRTRFSDQQLRLLQDAFEANPYPKDDDLEILSQKLKLNSRVIVVWFQNARQKARKSYENNQNDSNVDQQIQPNQLQQQQQQQQDEEFILKQEKDEGYSCKNCSKLYGESLFFCLSLNKVFRNQCLITLVVN